LRGEVVLTFVLGVITSLITELILFLVLKFLKSKKLKNLLSKAILHEDYFPFANQKSAIDDIRKKTKESATIRILSIRGLSYIGIDGDFKFVWDDDNKRIEIIFSDIDNHAINRRSRLFQENNKDYRNEMEHVKNYILEKQVYFQNLSFYLHQEDLAFRIIILDKYMYLSFFNAGIRASDSQIYRFERDSEIYKAFKTYYKNVRRLSKKIESEVLIND
jgi:hypothetical protein